MLTDVRIRKAKPADKPYKLTDGGGLHLYVSAAGSKLWRWRYEYAGKERLLSIGSYPEISLIDARAARDRARQLLHDGQDPSTAKRQKRFVAQVEAATTFEAVAREWHALNAGAWDDEHAEEVLRSLERDAFPKLGSRPITQIETPDVLEVLRAVEARGAADTARRIRQRISSVFVFAIAGGRAKADPAASVVKAMAPVARGRMPAITDLDKAQQILRDVDATPGFPVTKLAIRLLALTAVRPGVISTTPWEELPPDADLWVIPSERMKLRRQYKGDESRDHLVPLSRQARATIEAIRTITGRGKLVFPNTRHAHRPMSENAMGYMLNRAGYHHRHVPHGWRSTFSTVLNERYPGDREIIDFMLAHVPKDDVEAAYNRAKYLPRRKELAQIWADLLMKRQTPAMDLTRLLKR